MDKVAFTIFGIDIMWYGILMATGIMVASFIALKEAKRVGINEDYILDLAIFAIPIGLLGARLYYVLFNLDYYLSNPSQILNFRGGGMAIHGALIAGVLTGYIFCKVKKINFLQMADIVLLGAPLAQAIGRWGNFINQEAHGGPTDLPWGIMVNGEKVHPTFLYESIWNLIVFLILFFIIRKNKKYNGQVLFTYFGLYSLGRFFIEGLRTDSLMFGPFRVAQLVSLAFIISSILLHIYFKKKSSSKIETKLDENANSTINEENLSQTKENINDENNTQ